MLLQLKERRLESSLNVFRSLPQVLSSVRDVQRIVEYVDGCVLCSGNEDERFVDLLSSRNGAIMDATGMQKIN